MPKSKKALYTLKPSDGGKRVSKAIDFHQNLEGKEIPNELNLNGGDGGTTPEITFDQGELTAEIQFKPVSGGAEITADDEEFWAFVIAALTCHREDLIPEDEHEKNGKKGMDTFDYEGIKGGRAGELKNYIEGSKELIKNIFLPDTPYILFREDRVINLTGQGSYTQSLHTLINKAAGEIRGPGFKKDSWNPSDIVACVPQAYEEFVKEWNSELTYAKEGLIDSFDMFNATLKNYLASREVIGISLKKISDVGRIHIEKVNMKESEDELNSPASPSREVTYRCTRYPSVDLRSESEGGLVAGIQIEADLTNPDETLLLKYKTGGGTTLQLEGTIAKQSAKLGKCPKFLLGDLLGEYGVRLGRESSYVESKDLMQGFADIDSVSVGTRMQVGKLEDEIQEILSCEGLNLKADGKPLSAENIKALARKKPENTSDENAQAMWPRIIDFLDLLAKAKNSEEEGAIDNVVRRLYRGAKKEFDSCAPFIKVW